MDAKWSQMTNITGILAILGHCGVDPVRLLWIIDKLAMFGQFGKGAIFGWTPAIDVGPQGKKRFITISPMCGLLEKCRFGTLDQKYGRNLVV